MKRKELEHQPGRLGWMLLRHGRKHDVWAKVDRADFSVEVQPVGRDVFEVGSSDGRRMVGLLLRRQRHKSGLSLAQVADRLGSKSGSTYARYERGLAVPTIEKLDELLRIVAPGRDLVLLQSAAA